MSGGQPYLRRSMTLFSVPRIARRLPRCSPRCSPTSLAGGKYTSPARRSLTRLSGPFGRGRPRHFQAYWPRIHYRPFLVRRRLSVYPLAFSSHQGHERDHHRGSRKVPPQHCSSQRPLCVGKGVIMPFKKCKYLPKPYLVVVLDCS